MNTCSQCKSTIIHPEHWGGLPYVPSCQNCGATMAKDQLTQFRTDTAELLMEKPQYQGAQAIWEQLSKMI